MATSPLRSGSGKSGISTARSKSDAWRPNPSGPAGAENDLRNDWPRSGIGMRSCGRFGPATLGTTSPRSNVRTSRYSGSGASGVRKSPWSFVNRSTNSIKSSSRPVRRKYPRVASSTGKKPIVAPYSGDMLLIVARSGTESACIPGPKNSTNRPTTP